MLSGNSKCLAALPELGAVQTGSIVAVVRSFVS